MKEADRYSRQRKLGQVGDDGQLRLEAHRLRIPESYGGSPEAMLLYGGRAGMQPPVDGGPRLPALPESLNTAFRHAACRSLGLGAAAALSNALTALQLAPDGDPTGRDS